MRASEREGGVRASQRARESERASERGREGERASEEESERASE